MNAARQGIEAAIEEDAQRSLDDFAPHRTTTRFYQQGRSPREVDRDLRNNVRYLRHVDHDMYSGGAVVTRWRARAEIDAAAFEPVQVHGRRQYIPQPYPVRAGVLDSMCRELADAIPMTQEISGVDVETSNPVTGDIWKHWSREVITIQVRTNEISQQAWVQWNDSFTSTGSAITSFSATNGASTNAASFPYTPTTSATAITTANDDAWRRWNLNYDTISRHVRAFDDRTTEERRLAAMTPDERMAHEAEQARQREQRQRLAEQQAAERAAAHEAARVVATQAEDRAEELLHSMLSKRQIDMLTREGKFLVEVNGGRVYEINRGREHNVYLLDGSGKRVQELCAHVRPRIPNSDNLVAQLLALQTEEDEFRKVANIWDISQGRMDSISGAGHEAPGSLIAL